MDIFRNIINTFLIQLLESFCKSIVADCQFKLIAYFNHVRMRL